MDSFIFYQSLFEGTGDLSSILKLPYPLYRDIILKQVEERKRERKEFDEELNMQKIKAKNRSKK